MTKHYRKVTKRLTPFTAGGPLFHNFVIEKGVLLTKVVVFLQGVFTLAGGAASGTAIGENPTALLQQIKIEATSKAADYPGGVLKKLTPRGILRRMEFDHGKSAPDLNLGASGISGAAASFTLKSPLEMPFAHPKILNPIETSLRLDRYSQLIMTVTGGSRDTLFTGNDRTPDYTGMYLDVIEFREYAGADGNYQPKAVLYDEDVNIPINQINPQKSLNNELQSSQAYVDIVWWFETTNNALVDTILNEMFLRSGTEEFFRATQDALKAEQRRYLTDAADSMTGLVYTNVAYDLRRNLTELSGAVADLGATLDVANPGGAGVDEIWIGRRTVAPVPGRAVRADGG